jgi:tyrosyl-DNA phosphodiesterase 2
VILDDPWIRAHHVVVPTKPEHWPRRDVGNVTLVSRTVPVDHAASLEFYYPNVSPLQRHALFVDIRLGATTRSAKDDDRDERILRIANVHLESMPAGAPFRHLQLQFTTMLLFEAGIHAGIVAGDMNAILPQDWALPALMSMADAWTGPEDGRGNTWGYQPPARQAGVVPTRLDKVLYHPSGNCVVEQPHRVGVGVKTASGRWASDHFGVLTSVRLLVP